MTPQLPSVVRVAWAGSRHRARSHGFTLIELIIVLLLVGVLAVVALPRMFDSQAFVARAFHDATMATLRQGQKSAIAERRTVCVAFDTTEKKMHLTMRRAASDVACAYAVGVDEIDFGPGGTPLEIKAPEGVNYSPTPSNFQYSPLGRASTATVISIAGEADILVEAESGYVHSP